jgi:hypothetical protein
MPYRYFDDIYVYGPITQEEFDNLTVNHRMTMMNSQIYIGVSQEILEFSDRLVPRPQPEEIPVQE